MIKINLLGEEIAPDYSGTFILAGFAASMVVLLVVCGYLYSSITSSIEELTGEVSLQEAQLAKLRVVTKEVRELEVKKTELRDKLAVIARLKRNKIGPVRVMDDLNLAVPERAWLSDVREREGSLQINGMALDDQTIAAFMRELEQSEYFGTVDLVQSQKKKWKDVTIKEFSLEAKVNYAGKIAPPAEAAGTEGEAPKESSGGKA